MYIRQHGRRGQLTLNAPAKVNLHLEVKGMRRDGYHEILSIVQSVPLYDRVYIRSLKTKSGLRIRCAPPVPGGQNIAATAVQVFQSACRIEAGIEIQIEKRIPMGAGLGGGSSDAAAVLIGLNEVFGSPLESDQLHVLAAGLGADVSFFLNGPAAIMSGRGDLIHPIVPRKDILLLLVYPGFPIATGQAYRWLDSELRRDQHQSLGFEELEARFERTAPDCWEFFNSFQLTLESRYPLIRRITSQMKQAGAHLAAVSGSGSSIVGVFTDVRAAGSACDRLRGRYRGVWLLVPLQSDGPAD